MSKRLIALGLMSGTSMDGIDAAIIETDGEAFIDARLASSTPYTAAERRLLEQALLDARQLRHRDGRPGCLAEAEDMLTAAHGRVVAELVSRSGIDKGQIAVIGFHGQTVLHRPDAGLTVQLGDGEALARFCEIPVVYDMRAADMAAGGQGAPMAPAYHRALANSLVRGDDVAFVNVGGISNVTFAGANGELLAFDTGPGNNLIDQWVQRHSGETYDSGGRLAAQGRVSDTVRDKFLENPFFAESPPKSLDRGDFSLDRFEALSPADGARTMANLTAHAIVRAADHFPRQPKIWIICGGGRHNPVIMADLSKLAELNGTAVLSAEGAGLDGDMIEAQAWAYLAVRSLNDLPLTWPGTTGVREPVTGGVLARP